MIWQKRWRPTRRKDAQDFEHATGVIATYNAGRGYGFISPIKTDGSDGDSEDLFFHVSAFDDGVKILCGERVGYETAPSRSQYGVNREMAVNIKYI